MKLSVFSVSAPAAVATLLAAAGSFNAPQASAAYPESCTVDFLFEAGAYPNNTPNARTTTATLTATETAHTVTVAPSTTPMNSFLMYVTEKDCPVKITSVTIDDDGDTDKVPGTWGVFDGTTVADGVFTWPTGAQDWAGFSNGNTDIYPLNITGGATVTITGRTKPEELTDEEVACADTSVIRFEDAFDGTTVSCLTDTYEWPTGAKDWAGFGDTKRGDYYPFKFPNGGKITFNASTNTEAVVAFQFENAPYPNNSVVERVRVTVPASGGSSKAEAEYSIDVPASTTTFNNLLLYIETRDVPVVVKDIAVTANEAETGGGDNGGSTDDSTVPVPSLPLGGLLGLIGLVGWLGLRRRG